MDKCPNCKKEILRGKQISATVYSVYNSDGAISTKKHFCSSDCIEKYKANTNSDYYEEIWHNIDRGKEEWKRQEREAELYNFKEEMKSYWSKNSKIKELYFQDDLLDEPLQYRNGDYSSKVYIARKNRRTLGNVAFYKPIIKKLYDLEEKYWLNHEDKEYYIILMSKYHNTIYEKYADYWFIITRCKPIKTWWHKNIK